MQDEDAGRPYRKFMWVSKSCLTIIMDEENGVVHKNLQALPFPYNFLSCVWSVACGFKDTFPFLWNQSICWEFWIFSLILPWHGCSVFMLKFLAFAHVINLAFPYCQISSGSKVSFLREAQNYKLFRRTYIFIYVRVRACLTQRLVRSCFSSSTSIHSGQSSPFQFNLIFMGDKLKGWEKETIHLIVIWEVIA